MKKTKIIIFVTALALLLFANISVTLFDGSEDEIKIQLNNERSFANDETDHLFEMAPDGSDGDGRNKVICYSESYVNPSYTYTYCGTCLSKTGRGFGETLKCKAPK